MIGWLRRDEVDVEYAYDKWAVAIPAELFPPELRAPNCEIWVVHADAKIVGMLPRHGYEQPPGRG